MKKVLLVLIAFQLGKFSTGQVVLLKNLEILLNSPLNQIETFALKNNFDFDSSTS